MPRQKKQHLKKRPDGRYACRYKDMWFYGSTEDEALQAREEYKRGDRFIPVTVSDYAEKWLPLHKSGVRPNTLRAYRHYLAVLTDTIGDELLSDITPDDAAEVWLKYKGMSASSVGKAKGIYTAMFDSAVENDLCRRNPFRARSLKLPKTYAGSHRALTQEEIALVRSTPHRMQPAAMVMLYAGLRKGEVTALLEEDVDLDAGIIHVNKSIRYEANQPIVSPTKTPAGVRDVPIVKPLRELLNAHTGRVLTNMSGGTMSDRSFKIGWDAYMNALSRAAGHPVSIRPHDLRHTYCTMLRDAGVEMKQAMIWMGHSNEKLILHIYDHAGETRASVALKLLESFVS